MAALSRGVGSDVCVANRELMCCLSDRREVAPTWPMEKCEAGCCWVGLYPSRMFWRYCVWLGLWL